MSTTTQLFFEDKDLHDVGTWGESRERKDGSKLKPTLKYHSTAQHCQLFSRLLISLVGPGRERGLHGTAGLVPPSCAVPRPAMLSPWGTAQSWSPVWSTLWKMEQ